MVATCRYASGEYKYSEISMCKRPCSAIFDSAHGRNFKLGFIPGIHLRHLAYFILGSGDVEYSVCGRLHRQVRQRGGFPNPLLWPPCGGGLRATVISLIPCSLVLASPEGFSQLVRTHVAGISSARSVTTSLYQISVITCRFSLAPLYLLVRTLPQALLGCLLN